MTQNTATRVCPNCSAGVSGDNYEYVEDADYVRIDCPECGEVGFREIADPEDRKEKFTNGQFSGTEVEQERMEQEKEVKMLEAVQEGRVGIDVESDFGPEGSCCRPGCEQDAEKHAVSERTGRLTGKLCEEHYEDAISKDSFSPRGDE